MFQKQNADKTGVAQAGMVHDNAAVHHMAPPAPAHHMAPPVPAPVPAPAQAPVAAPPPALVPPPAPAPAPSPALIPAASSGVDSLDSLATASGVSKAELATWDLDDIKEMLRDEHKCSVPVRKKIEVRAV